MDTDICGLNKVVCSDVNDTLDGETVTITNGVNTWTKTITDQLATFLIPSMPAPAKKTYTVTAGDFSKEFELGFGDSIVIKLAEGYEPVLENFITSNLTANGNKFKFAYSGGKYGYNIGTTFHPFKTGAESFACYLGTGSDINVASKLTAINNNYGVYIDPSSLTASNFICYMANGGSSSAGSSGSTTISSVGKMSLFMNASFNRPSWSYSNGHLYVSGGSLSAHAWGSGWDLGTQTDSNTVYSYLVKSF